MRTEIWSFCLGVAVFLAAWVLCAATTPPWGDEIIHMSTGKGLLATGKDIPWNFSTGKLENYFYPRGLIISNIVSWIYSFTGASFFWARLVPVFFTVMTFVIFILYSRKYFGWKGYLLTAALLFLFNPIIFEESLYVRMYAPLGLIFLLALMLLWDIIKHYRQRPILLTGIEFLVFIAVLMIPVKDHWQSEHIIMAGIAGLFTIPYVWQLAMKFLRNKKAVIICLALILLIAPFIVLIIDQWLSQMPVGNRTLGLSFVTYWDNMAGLVRFMWSINIALCALAWITKKDYKQNFFSWIYVTGICCGLIVAFFLPVSFIFYARYFYVPLVLVILGFIGMIAFDRRQISTNLITVAMVLNIALAGIVFYYDRSTIGQSIQWLKKNIQTDDVIIAYNPYYELHGAQKLIDQSIFLRDVQSTQEIDHMVDVISKPNVKRVFFLTEDFHRLRETLFQWTTGKSRVFINDTYREIEYNAPGQDVLKGMRMCTFKVYDPRELATFLKVISARGFANTIPPISMHKHILKRVFGWIGLPTTRKELLKKYSGQ